MNDKKSPRKMEIHPPHVVKLEYIDGKIWENWQKWKRGYIVWEDSDEIFQLKVPINLMS